MSVIDPELFKLAAARLAAPPPVDEDEEEEEAPPPLWKRPGVVLPALGGLGLAGYLGYKALAGRGRPASVPVSEPPPVPVIEPPLMPTAMPEEIKKPPSVLVSEPPSVPVSEPPLMPTAMPKLGAVKPRRKDRPSPGAHLLAAPYPRRELTPEEEERVREGEQRILPRIFQNYGTRPEEAMSSPAWGAGIWGTMAGLPGAAVGGLMGAGALGAAGGPPAAALGGLMGMGMGGLATGLPAALYAYWARQANNEDIKETMRRTPEGATRRDLLADPVYQLDRQRSPYHPAQLLGAMTAPVSGPMNSVMLGKFAADHGFLPTMDRAANILAQRTVGGLQNVGNLFTDLYRVGAGRPSLQEEEDTASFLRTPKGDYTMLPDGRMARVGDNLPGPVTAKPRVSPAAAKGPGVRSTVSPGRPTTGPGPAPKPVGDDYVRRLRLPVIAPGFKPGAPAGG